MVKIEFHFFVFFEICCKETVSEIFCFGFFHSRTQILWNFCDILNTFDIYKQKKFTIFNSVKKVFKIL